MKTASESTGRWLTAVIIAGLLFTACGGSAAPGVAPTAAGPAAATSALATLKTRILVTITDRCCINFAFMLVGARIGAFQEAGLDVEWIPQVPGASPAMAATLSGQADITNIAFAGAIAAAAAGRPARIMSVEGVNTWAAIAIPPKIQAEFAAKGITVSSPWQDKIKAFKGKRYFVSSPGGPTEIRARQLFSSLGMDPDKDVILQPGTPETSNAAWRAGQLDSFSCCEPATFTLMPDAVVWVKTGEIQIPIKGYSGGLATTTDYATKNPEVLRRVIAVEKKMRTLFVAAVPGSKERDTVLKALKEQYPDVDATLIAKSFDASRLLYDVDQDMTRQGLQDTIDDYNVGAPANAKALLKPEELAAPGLVLK